MFYLLLTTVFVGVTTMPHNKNTLPATQSTTPKGNGEIKRQIDSMIDLARTDPKMLKIRQAITLLELKLKDMEIRLQETTKKTDSITVDPGIVDRVNFTQ